MNSNKSLVEQLLEYADDLHISTKSLDRNDYLLSAGKVDSNLYLVEHGVFRIFYISEFDEQTLRFGYKGSTITALESFFNNEPSGVYIQAIKKSTVKVIPNKQLRQIISSNTDLQLAYINLLEQFALQQMEREIDILSHSPIERYKRVLARSPQLFQEVPAKYIANYLRMTPETFSRINKS